MISFISNSTKLSTGFTNMTFGRMQNGSGIYNQLVGVLSMVEICNIITDCPSLSTTSRSNYVNLKLKMYENYWDLTTSTSFNRNAMINPCKVRASTGPTNLYFTKSSTEDKPPFPTNQGWFCLYDNVWVYSENLDYSDSHQITIEFEVFPLNDASTIHFYPYEDRSNSDRMKFNFRSRSTSINNPYAYSSTFNLESRKWNRVHISLAQIDSTDTFKISVYKQILSAYGASTQTPEEFTTTGLISSKGLIATGLKLAFFDSQMILRKVKFYKWALNSQSIIDSGTYSESGDISYTFQLNNAAGYFDHFSDNKIIISNSTNACMVYTTNSDVCCDLTHKGKENCLDGFDKKNKFCIDTCGDGSVKLNPQVYGCDDGNSKNGDGCSSKCFVEDGYSCSVLSNLNNKSYCQKMCGNGVYDSINSELCDDGNFLSGDGCKQDCTTETGFKCINYATKPSFCYPNCGDGIRDTTPTVEQCDDGNNMDLDGCSGTCQVETNYVCTSGLTADVCTTIYKQPVVLTTSFDPKTLKIVVEFDQVMLNQNVSSFDVNVDVSGPNSPYSVSWSASFSQKQFIVKFSMSPALLGGIGETVLLQLITVTKFKSEHEIPKAAPQQFTFSVAALSASESTQSGGSGASYMFIFTMLLSIGISVLTGGSMELMWSLANTLQILFYFGMLNLYFSSDLIAVYGFLKFSNFDNPISDYISTFVKSILSFSSSNLGSNFGNLGFDSTNILALCLSKILFVVLIILIICIFAFLSYYCRDKNNRVVNFIKMQDKKMRYESFSRFIVELTLNLTVACLINIVFGAKYGLEDLIAYIVAVITLFILILFVLYTIVYPHYYYESINQDPAKHERHKMLFEEFKSQNIKCTMYFAFFLLRRQCFASVVVCMSDFTTHQCILIMILCLWIFAYQFRCMPYKSKLQNFICCFNEGVLFVYSCLMFVFLDNRDANKLKTTGYICVFLIAMFFLVNWIIICPVMIYKSYISFKNYSKKVYDKCRNGSNKKQEKGDDPSVSEGNQRLNHQDTQEKMLNCNDINAKNLRKLNSPKEYLVIPDVQWGPNKFIQQNFESKIKEPETARFNNQNE